MVAPRLLFAQNWNIIIQIIYRSSECLVWDILICRYMCYKNLNPHLSQLKNLFGDHNWENRICFSQLCAKTHTN